MKIRAVDAILNSNLVWGVALYARSEKFSFLDKLGDNIKLFGSRRLRISVRHVHTRADPFLFVFNNELYLFYESMSVNEVGCIAAYKTEDLINFDYLGVVLKEPHHLSYPFVFEHESSIFMIPESGSSGEVVLYRFENFPLKLKKIRVLLKGNFFDSSIVFKDGMWYLFTTSHYGLEIYFTKDLEHGDFSSHPHNPITNDPRYSRCGGQPVVISGSTYRIAQDCSIKYGGNINILRILELTPDKYREERTCEGYFDCTEKWNAEGGHHLSIAIFRGQTVVAVDGRQRDFFVNKILSPFFSSLQKLRQYLIRASHSINART